MISYHPLKNGTAACYAHGFLGAETDDLERIGRGIARYAWSPIAWDGGRRRQDHFLYADLCVLDFDSPKMSLGEALAAFRSYAHVIGTTKSHRREKGGVVCDRFRVCLRFAHRITSAKTYAHSLRLLAERYPADLAALDAARFFFPCRDIISVRQFGVSVPVVEPAPLQLESEARRRWRSYRYAQAGYLPRAVRAFLERGDTVSKGRQHTAFWVARTLTEYGYDASAVRTMIEDAPFPRDGLSAGEIPRAINNGIAEGSKFGRAPRTSHAD